MSRYIDADAMKANCDIMVGNTTIGRRDYVMFHEIDSAPSIDIVFCKECTERNDDWCMYWQNVINPDDFCSYGERKESE